jgi:hypothetical protein
MSDCDCKHGGVTAGTTATVVDGGDPYTSVQAVIGECQEGCGRWLGRLTIRLPGGARFATGWCVLTEVSDSASH